MYFVMNSHAISQNNLPQIREYKVILEESGDSILAIGPFINDTHIGIHRYFDIKTEKEIGFVSLTLSGERFYSEYSTKDFNYIFELDTLTKHIFYRQVYKHGLDALVVHEYFDLKNEIEILKSYYPNGNLEKYIYFVNSKLNGLLCEYFPDGILKYIISYNNGIMDGPNLEYFENGNIKMSSYYNIGNLHGEKATYSEDGSKVVQYYEYGRLIH